MESPSRRRSGGTHAGAARPPHRATPAAAWCALVLAIGAAGTGCSSGGSSPSLAGPSGSTSPSLAATQPTATADAKTQILSQYESFWAALTPASRAAASKRRELLQPFAAQPELDSLLRGMAAADAKGEVFYGANVPRARLLRLNEGSGVAVVDDCQNSSKAGLARRSSGQQLTVGVARNHVVATMHQSTDGKWRVAFISYSRTKC